MGIKNTFGFIKSHPLTKDQQFSSLLRLIRWQLTSRICKGPLIHNFIGDAKLVVKKGLTGATGNIYAGLHEFTEMSFLLHLLREEDWFVDVGANVGSYTVLASGYCKAYTLSFEPIDNAYKFLLENIRVNRIENLVIPRNIALGSENDILLFTNSLDTVNHVKSAEDHGPSTSVTVIKTDNALAGIVPVLMKIDVEGFETEVVKGASQTLQNSALRAIIIELNGSGSRYGYNEWDIHEQLVKQGFQSYGYYPFERKLEKFDDIGSHNTIYIRDIFFVTERIRTAIPINILGYSY